MKLEQLLNELQQHINDLEKKIELNQTSTNEKC